MSSNYFFATIGIQNHEDKKKNFILLSIILQLITKNKMENGKFHMTDMTTF